MGSRTSIRARFTGPVADRRPSLGMPLLGGGGAVLAADGGEVPRGVDQADVGERLGEVPELAVGLAVILLGEQADVVANGQEAVVDLPGRVATPLERQVV